MEALSVYPVKQFLFCPEGSVLSARVKSLPVELKTFKKRSGFDPFAALQLRNFIKKTNPDLIHIHDAHAHTLAILSCIWGVKKPMILHRRVDFPIRRKWFTEYKYNHHCIKRIICVSDAIKQVMTPLVERPERLITIHSGFSPIKASKSEAADKIRNLTFIPENIPLVGNVSALADHKDYPTFLRTAAQLVSIGFEGHFIIMGDGELKESLQQLCANLQLEGRVHFMGFREDARSLMAGLDCLLFTSKTEGLGTTVLDAMSAKVPVVATAAGGVPEMVIDLETGWLCNIGDVSALSTSVMEVFRDETLRIKITEHASARLAMFSVDEMARKTLSLYKDVLQDK